MLLSINRWPRALAVAGLGWFTALLAGVASASTAPGTEPALPIASFVQKANLSGVSLSPSGKRLAMLMRTPENRIALAVLDLPRTSPARFVARFREADVQDYFWATDDRLVYSAYRDGVELFEGEGGTFAVNHDGSAMRTLVAVVEKAGSNTGSRISQNVLPFNWHIAGPIRDGSGDVVALDMHERADGDTYVRTVARLNTQTGRSTSLSLGLPAMPSRVLLDARGEPKVVVVVRDGRHRVHLRSDDGKTWEQIVDQGYLDATTWEPVLLEGKDQLVVATYGGSGSYGYYLYDLSKRQLDKDALVAVKGYDLGAPVVDWQRRELMGVRLVTDAPQTVWLDERLQQVQKALDAALPAGRFNTILCQNCGSAQQFVVLSQSDRQPGEYLLFDRAKGTLESLGREAPQLEEARQGRRSFHRVEARDGLSIPVVVTHPPGARDDEKLPAVLVVHGGPYMRGGDRRWEKEAQFLASRGYRVLEPEFRGSTGFGLQHQEAGHRQWGLAMQDDLADTVAWAAKQGLIDDQRVCIYGASYGGYAALMAPITHPGVFRCSASYAGVTDIRLLITGSRSDMSPQGRNYFVRDLIGDPVADRERLDRTSPLLRVAEIKVPVLLAHGDMDRRVTPEHAQRFVRAARDAGVDIEQVRYPREGHAWADQDSHENFLGRLERFLAKSLKR